MNYATLTDTERRALIQSAVLHVPSSALQNLWRTLHLPEEEFRAEELGRHVRRAFADTSTAEEAGSRT